MSYKRLFSNIAYTYGARRSPAGESLRVLIAGDAFRDLCVLPVPLCSFFSRLRRLLPIGSSGHVTFRSITGGSMRDCVDSKFSRCGGARRELLPALCVSANSRWRLFFELPFCACVWRSLVCLEFFYLVLWGPLNGFFFNQSIGLSLLYPRQNIKSTIAYEITYSSHMSCHMSEIRIKISYGISYIIFRRIFLIFN